MLAGRSRSEKKKAISKTSSWQKSMGGKYQAAKSENQILKAMRVLEVN